MRIPPRLDEILSRNATLHSAVQLTISQFLPWIRANHVVFFQEYTDHGSEHIEAVFNAAASLISDVAYSHVSPEDVEVLLLAILVHDIGMHFTKEGFCRLIDTSANLPRVQQFAVTDMPWPILWEQFLHDAERWSAQNEKR